MTCRPLRVGLALAILLAAFHALWAGVVALGWAQPLLDFVFWAHFITPPYHVDSFSMTRAAALIALVFAVGWAAGAGGGWLWNRIAATR